jgi:uncharacterized membrane protein YidH (DUF202 family)
MRPPETAGDAPGLSLWIGTALILLGVLVNLLVSAEHLRLMRQIQSVPPYGLRSWLLGVGVSLVLAVLGIAMAVYLVFVGHERTKRSFACHSSPTR